MKRLFFFSTILLVFLAYFPSFAQKEVRKVDSFSRINVGVNADVYITQDSNQLLELEGDDEDLQKIVTEVENGQLTIKTEKSWRNWNWSNDKVRIFINVADLKGLHVSGSSDVKGINIFSGKELAIKISGSGSIIMEVETGNLDAVISGSGSIDLKGKAENTIVKISGSGKIDAEELKTETCNVKISGSGNFAIHTNQSLNATISGSGNVYYKGTPKSVNLRSSGSGKVIKRT